MPKWLSFGGGVLALLIGIIATVLGFKKIKTKRYIENIPTSLSKGLAYGPAEIKGKQYFTRVMHTGSQVH